MNGSGLKAIIMNLEGLRGAWARSVESGFVEALGRETDPVGFDILSAHSSGAPVMNDRGFGGWPS